jgi:hypothetical protein
MSAQSDYIPPGRRKSTERSAKSRAKPGQPPKSLQSEPDCKPEWRPEWKRRKGLVKEVDTAARCTSEELAEKLAASHDAKWQRYEQVRAGKRQEQKELRAEAKLAAQQEDTELRGCALEQLTQGGFIDFLGRLDVTLSPAQYVLCAVCFDGAQPTDLDPELVKVIFGDVAEIDPQLLRWLTWVIGGRSGKSYLGALAILWRGLVSDLTQLAPGEEATGLIVCPDLRLARHTLQYIRGAVKLPQVASAIKLKGDSSDNCTIERPDGKCVTFSALPATSGGSAVRARTLVAAMLDECAFFRDDDYAVNDRDIYQAVSPRVTIPGGFTLSSSTPWAEAGLLHEDWAENWGHPESGVAAHVSTGLMRADSPVLLAEIEHSRNKDPKNAAREFDAQFGVVSNGLFFPSETVATSIQTGQIIIPVAPKARVLIVCDASFSQQSEDKFGWAAVTSAADPYDRAGDEKRARRLTVVHECDAWEVDRSPREMARRLRDEVCERYGTRQIIIDQFSDLAFAELCSDVGLLVDIVKWVGGDSEDSKAERYRRTRTSMLSGQLHLPDSPVLKKDLAACKSKLLPGGGESIGVARTRRGHGDVLSAVILGASEAILNPGRFTADELTEQQRQDAEAKRLFRAAQKRAAERARAR